MSIAFGSKPVSLYLCFFLLACGLEQVESLSKRPVFKESNRFQPTSTNPSKIQPSSKPWRMRIAADTSNCNSRKNPWNLSLEQMYWNILEPTRSRGVLRRYECILAFHLATSFGFSDWKNELSFQPSPLHQNSIKQNAHWDRPLGHVMWKVLILSWWRISLKISKSPFCILLHTCTKHARTCKK